MNDQPIREDNLPQPTDETSINDKPERPKRPVVSRHTLRLVLILLFVILVAGFITTLVSIAKRAKHKTPETTVTTTTPVTPTTPSIPTATPVELTPAQSDAPANSLLPKTSKPKPKKQVIVTEEFSSQASASAEAGVTADGSTFANATAD